MLIKNKVLRMRRNRTLFSISESLSLMNKNASIRAFRDFIDALVRQRLYGGVAFEIVIF